MNEGPLYTIICFLKFNYDEKSIMSKVLSPFHAFPNTNNIVKEEMSSNAFGPNNFGQIFLRRSANTLAKIL